MLERWLFAGVLVFCWVAPVSAGEAGKSGTLKVRFAKLEKKGGHVLLQVANSRAVYESDDQFTYSAKIPAEGESVTATFDDVPHGEYAVKVFHDANDNERVDIGWRGPTESYGFSNDVMGFMGPPDFDDAKFRFASPEKTVDITAK